MGIFSRFAGIFKRKEAAVLAAPAHRSLPASTAHVQPRSPARLPLAIGYTRSSRLWGLGDDVVAKNSADGGSLLMVAQLVEDMLSDGVISGTTQVLSAGLIRLPLTVDGPTDIVTWLVGGEKKRAAAIWKMHPHDVMTRIIVWGILFGLGLGEYVEDPKTGEAVLHFVEPHHLTWHRDPVTGQQVLEYNAVGDPQIVCPGNGRWFVFAPWGLQRFWTHGKWRPCARAWIDKTSAQDQRSVHGNRIAMGLTWVETPEKRSRDADSIEIADALANPAPPVLVLETGFKINHTPIGGDGYQQWTSAKEEADSDIVIALTGQTVTSGMTGSGWSKGDIHQQLAQTLIEEYAMAISTSIQRDGVEPAVERRGVNPECVSVEFDATAPGERDAAGKAAAALGDGITKANAALLPEGKRVVSSKLASQCSVDIEDIEAAPETSVSFRGIPLVIEYEPGSIRSGVSVNGAPWAVSMGSNAYGFIPGTESEDGEPLDVYLGMARHSSKVFVLRQLDTDGEFDELKLFLGYESMGDAQFAWSQLVGRAELDGGWNESSLDVIRAFFNAAPTPVTKARTVEQSDEPSQIDDSSFTAAMSIDVEDDAVVDSPSDEDAVALAEYMTLHKIDRCDCGRVNKCERCGVKRKRVGIVGTDGKHAGWDIVWRAIGVNTQ